VGQSLSRSHTLAACLSVSTSPWPDEGLTQVSGTYKWQAQLES